MTAISFPQIWFGLSHNDVVQILDSACEAAKTLLGADDSGDSDCGDALSSPAVAPASALANAAAAIVASVSIFKDV